MEQGYYEMKKWDRDIVRFQVPSDPQSKETLKLEVSFISGYKPAHQNGSLKLLDVAFETEIISLRRSSLGKWNL